MSPNLRLTLAVLAAVSSVFAFFGMSWLGHLSLKNACLACFISWFFLGIWHDRKWQTFAKIYDKSFAETAGMFQGKTLPLPNWVDKFLLFGVVVLLIAYFTLVISDVR